ncbi:MAG: class B sortase [Oscillospiraceae bacterium]|jgi:sortase B|nr:class B sortase [Oscillospiraceae bacterium]
MSKKKKKKPQHIQGKTGNLKANPKIEQELNPEIEPESKLEFKPDENPKTETEITPEPKQSANKTQSDALEAAPLSENSDSSDSSDSIKSVNSASKKTQKPRRLNYIRRLALIVCLGVLIFSGYNLIINILEYKEASDYYDSLGSTFLSTPNGSNPQNTPTPPPLPSGDGDTPPPDDIPPDPDDPQPSYVEDYAPDIWPLVDFDGLRDINPDTEAWIIGVGTNINYPVVHSSDNTEYLTKMFDGRTSKAGALFIDMRNSVGFSDRNTIIYGHNMRNHSMFWTVTQYRSQSFYNNHPTLRLITDKGNYEIQLYAGFVADAAESGVWRTQFSSDQNYMDWVDSLISRSSFKSYVEVTPADRTITLSTCTYEFNDARYVVMGKLVPVGDTPVDPWKSSGSSQSGQSVPPPFDVIPGTTTPPTETTQDSDNLPDGATDAAITTDDEQQQHSGVPTPFDAPPSEESNDSSGEPDEDDEAGEPDSIGIDNGDNGDDDAPGDSEEADPAGTGGAGGGAPTIAPPFDYIP